MRNLLLLKLNLCMACTIILLVAYSPIMAKTHAPMAGTQISVKKCDPTPADYLGPYYEPDAPVRSSVGKGHILEGAIMSSNDCLPIANARIEFWLTNPSGSYDDDHRATIFSDGTGEYSFESNIPPDYSGRPPHIHIRISAEGFKTLATQHYPADGQTTGEFDIVLVPLD